MKTKRLIRKEFLENKDKVSKIRELLSSKEFAEYIEVVSTYMSPYSVESSPSQIPHIEMERVGGIFGSTKFLHLLMNVVNYSADPRADDQEEFQKPSIK